jgi:hypothetical protein
MEGPAQEAQGEKKPAEGGLKKRHLGFFGVVMAVLEFLNSSRTERSTRVSVEESVRNAVSAQVSPVFVQIANQRADIERDFVRKSELSELTVQLGDVNRGVGDLNNKVSKIEGYLRAQQKNYGALWNERSQ